MDTPAPSLSSRLRHSLEVRGIPAHRASLSAGLSRAAAQWILSHPDRAPTVSTVEAFARTLRVDPAWLAFGAPYPEPVADAPAVDPEEPAVHEPAEEQPAEDGAASSPDALGVEPAREEHPAEVEVLPLAPPVEPAPAEPHEVEAPPAADGAHEVEPVPAEPAVDDPAAEALRRRWGSTPGATQRGCARSTAAAGVSQSTVSTFLARKSSGTPRVRAAVAAYLDTLAPAPAAGE